MRLEREDRVGGLLVVRGTGMGMGLVRVGGRYGCRIAAIEVAMDDFHAHAARLAVEGAMVIATAHVRWQGL